MIQGDIPYSMLNFRVCVVGLALILVGCASGAPAAGPTIEASNAPTPDAEATIAAELAGETLQAQGPTAPPGFNVAVAYGNLELPTALATDGKHFYVTEFQSGKVKRLTDTNNDGVFDVETVFADGLQFPRGIAIEPKSGDIFVASLGQINRLRDDDGDGRADSDEVVLKDLFYVDASHANNGIAFGPDGKLYITEGHPRKSQLEIKRKKVTFKDKPVPEWAGTILRADLDGSSDLRSSVEVYARGFRNPYDLVFANDGTLYATDNGEDLKQGTPEGDELNLIVQGGDYGFPFYLGDPPPDSGTRAPLISFPQATSPNGLVVYEGTRLPEEYRGNIFIALFSDPRRVVRAWRGATGKWQYEDFVTGLDRPIDIAVGADGALYVADMNTGEKRQVPNPDRPAVIYRVDFVGR